MTIRSLILALLAAVSAAAQAAHTDRTTYNAGEIVRIADVGGARSAALRYAGEPQPVASNLPLKSGAGYNVLWTVPANARTGRYEVLLDGAPATTFAVHRKLVQIESVDFDHSLFTSGDPVAARVRVRNLAGRRLDGLRVEFSEYYFPWIAPGKYNADVHPTVLAADLALDPGAERILSSDRAIPTAAAVKQPAVTSYTVVVWDRSRRDVLDLFFTRDVFIQPPNVDLPKPYPFLYLYPELKWIGTNTKDYRRFYPPELDFAAIRFERSHTMFPAGATGSVGFTVNPPGPAVTARLRGPGGKEYPAPLSHDGPRYTASVHLPQEGLYTLEVTTPAGSNQLELAANVLPKSILVFAAHEDDDMAHPATIRAAIENHIPIHFVYYTSGDAGGCDRYFARSCGPEQALDFGQVRMQETRAALAHLGVPAENIHFLGMPDGGLEQIWYYHRQPANPYLSVLLASDHAPYREAAVPNLPYSRDSAIEAAKKYIRQYHPDLVITGHPDEGHVDHRTNNWLTLAALRQLLGSGEVPRDLVVRVDQVYGPGPQKHAPYHYRKHVLYVSGEAAARAQEAYWYYQSQDGNHFQGAIKPYADLPREEIHYQVLDWQDHAGWNDQP